MQQALISEPPTRSVSKIAQPYSPSWLNRLADRVERLPGPPWAFYLGAWLALFISYTAVKWLDGTYAAGTLFPFHAVLAGLIVYAAAASHYLSYVAGKALRTFRPLLKGDDALYQDLLYRLTRLPQREALLAGLTGLTYATSAIQVLIPSDFWHQRRMFTSAGWSVAADYLMSEAMWAMLGVALYNVLHQLRLVSRIYTRHTNLNLFSMGPLYEFSRVTARAALAAVLGLYAWFAADPSPLADNADPNFIGVLLAIGSIALLAFVQPLLGLHGLLVAEKQRLHEENGRQFEIASAMMHSRVSAGELAEVEKLEKALNGLAIERSVLEKLRTWPWEPETARVVATATLLPLVLCVLQRALDRLTF
ncbi:MAG TPA: hypothetical protein VF914_06110 [Chloroflexia bacterium]